MIASLRFWKKMIYLPGVNVWIAFNLQSHKHHTAARSWYDDHFRDGCAFCRQTQLSFLRLITNPKIHGDDAITMNQAWAAYERMLSHPHIEYIEEPKPLDPLLKSFTSTNRFAPNLWSDAYLAAFAIRANLHLVTFDTGFRQYPGLNCTVLS